MFKDPSDCKKYGRSCKGPSRAKVFDISHLLKMWQASRENPRGPTLRAWTYVLLSCSLFLRKSEAVNMKLGDIDRTTGKPLLSEGLPRYIFVHIRRSKTDQEALGKEM